ncbi:MAG: adenylate/guanylate cyclase domain-containing protein [Synechococcaceae cyanobacterium]|nr:adenylate/guanylate cyclase domain-containing protein [Synechococcaceae cyanobacterium]
MSRRGRITTALAGLVLLATGWSAGWPAPAWRSWELGLEDQLQRLRGTRRPPAAVLLVPIDDATLQQGSWFEQHRRIPDWARGIGTLPWPRAAYGALAERLLQAGAAAVAINVVFEGSSSRGANDDARLAATLERHPGRIALAAEMLEASDNQGAGALTLVRPEALLPALGAADRLGLTNVLPPTPTQPSRHPEAYGRGLLPSLGVAAQPSLSSTLLRLAGRSSRQDDPQRALAFYGPEGSFARLPAWEVLDPERWRQHPLRRGLSGRLVLVGPVVSQGDDGYPSPFGPISGLELLATATANSLQGDGLRPWPDSAPLRAALAVAPLLLVLLLALRHRSLLWRLGSVIGLIALQLSAAGLALAFAALWLPLLPPLTGLVLLGLLYSGDAYLQEGLERRRLRRTFERYVAPGVVAEILADPASAQGILRGRLLEVTVLMTDLQGFTSLTRERSARGQSELHVQQLNAYLGAMVEVITAHGGTIDKFIGDAVLAVFGSPVGRGVEREAQAALRCALAMRQALAALNRSWREQGIAELNNGIGLASGQVMVGQIGSPRRMEFTVIGDTVNLAARLESLTRSLELPVLCDARTAALAGSPSTTPDPGGGASAAGEDAPLPACRSLGPQPIKGMGEVEVFAAG